MGFLGSTGEVYNQNGLFNKNGLFGVVLSLSFMWAFSPFFFLGLERREGKKNER